MAIGAYASAFPRLRDSATVFTQPMDCYFILVDPGVKSNVGNAGRSFSSIFHRLRPLHFADVSSGVRSSSRELRYT